MNVKYLVSDFLIPDDGSRQIINQLKKLNCNDGEVYIYPDVHYKKGARTVNGILISSPEDIFPACLGVENCGFSFGKVEEKNIEKLKVSFRNYSQQLKAYQSTNAYSTEYINELFYNILKRDFDKRKELYNFLEIKSTEKLFSEAKKALNNEVIKKVKQSLGTLGGGNHFFELHKVVDVLESNKNIEKGDIVYMLHSDSVAVGDYINLLYSNLSELEYLKGIIGKIIKCKIRLRQIIHFSKNGMVFKDFPNICRLLFSQNDYRTIKASSALGKNLLFLHNIAYLFGEINRNLILDTWKESQNLKIVKLTSQAHDNISIEKNAGQIKVVHRNGVQYVGEDELAILPASMGEKSYILLNVMNESAYYSTNHGTGRVQDKHIAKVNYTANETEKELEKLKISLFRVGNGDIAEQNHKAFKNSNCVIREMEQRNLAKCVAKTMPFAVIKG